MAEHARVELMHDSMKLFLTCLMLTSQKLWPLQNHFLIQVVLSWWELGQPCAVPSLFKDRAWTLGGWKACGVQEEERLTDACVRRSSVRACVHEA